MSVLQKFAWFNLAVVAFSAAGVLTLLPFLGKGALGSFGFLGLLGAGVLFFCKKRGQVLMDERDRLIWLRAWILAYAVFWAVYCVVTAVLCTVVYGEAGAVPVWVVGSSVFGGLALVYALASIAILVQYARGSRNAE